MSKDQKKLKADFKKETVRYNKAEAEAMSMLPSGIISYAIDEVGNLFGWQPSPDEIRDAAQHIEQAIEEAVEAGDFNGRRNNTWDPRVFSS